MSAHRFHRVGWPDAGSARSFAMMRRLVGIMIGMLAAGPACHAASQAEADRIARSFETYLGHPAAGAAAPVTVTPDGDSYAISLNVAAIAAPLESFGIHISSPAWTFKAAPQADGRWLVTYGGNLPLDMTYPNGAVTMVSEDTTFEGTFDPRIMAFAKSSMVIPRLTSQSSATQPTGASSNVSRLSRDVRADSTATAAGDGVVSGKFTETIGNTSQHVQLTLPHKPEDTARPAMEFDLAMGDVSATGNVAGLRNQAILDLWAWLVAHPSKAAIVDAQTEFKSHLRAVLPFVDQLTAGADFHDVRVTTQWGRFAAATGSVGLDFSGFQEKGSISEKIALDGFSMPSALVPAWAQDVLPKAVSFDVNVSGFNPARTADLVLSNLDLSKTPPLNPDPVALHAAVLPTGVLTFKLNDVKLSADAFDVAVTGSIIGGPTVPPTGSGTVRAKGLDAVLDKLREAGASDKNAQNALIGLMVARGFAKPGDDGTLVWDIAMGDNGQLMVNDKPVGPPRQR
jgi:hypothetical protein